MSATFYTVGHSTNSLEQLLSLLKQHQITAVADVRSQPYSRLNPQFNREPFRSALKNCGLSYVYLGAELGARSSDPSCYVQGKAQYDLLASTASFQRGLERLQKGASKYLIALMCAEKEPLACHRTILVSRHLRERGFNVRHILGDGSLEDHDSSVDRLLRMLRIPEQDIFRSKADMVCLAYRLQADKIAYNIDEVTVSA